MEQDVITKQEIINRYYTNQYIQHQTGFFTTQDSAYNTKQDFLPLKTVHTTPNRISYTISIPITAHNSKPFQLHRMGLYQFILSSSHCSLLSHYRTHALHCHFIKNSFRTYRSQFTIIPVKGGIISRS